MVDAAPASAMFRLGSSSFLEYLAEVAPEAMPGGSGPAVSAPNAQGLEAPPHGTTIVACTAADAVVMAGDRRATVGHVIAQRDIEKVHLADGYSMVGIAGSAGIAMDMVRLLQLELEHYEKIEGVPLSMLGKANRLSTLIRSNLALAMQGLAAVPLFAGYDLQEQRGRIFSYDVTGGRYEEHDFFAVGSGAVFARGSLKKLYRPQESVQRATYTCVEALFDAADDDAATGGPDIERGIYPLVAVAGADGVQVLPAADVGEVVADVLAARRGSPDGPKAELTSLRGELS